MTNANEPYFYKIFNEFWLISILIPKRVRLNKSKDLYFRRNWWHISNNQLQQRIIQHNTEENKNQMQDAYYHNKTLHKI